VTTVAGAPGLVVAGLPEIAQMDWSAVGPVGWGALAYSTLLSLVVAYIIWNRSIQVVGPSRTVVYMCLTPLFAVASAAVLLGERPRPLQAVGALLILSGVVLSRLGSREHPAPVAPEG
jgi:drug/metabolite transporter (DMT)-like permease